MNRLVFVGLFTEGSTDIRFLESIVKRTLDELAYDCKGQIETDLLTIEVDKTGLGFVEQVEEASKKGLKDYGISILCVHTDADNALNRIIRTKIRPVLGNIKNYTDANCKNIVFIVPVQMVESWMLADKGLFKTEINSIKSDTELGIRQHPENLTDPKQTIENAIRIAKADMTRKKRGKGIFISDLYQILGQKIELEVLNNLPSYLRFKDGLNQALQQLNYL